MDVATVTSVQRPSADWRPLLVACRFLSQAVTVPLGVALCALPLQAQGADTRPGAHANVDDSAAKEPGAAAEESSFPLSAGDWLREFHRERKKLKDIGITFSLHERSEVWAVPIGGGKQGLSYNGLTTVKLDVNLETLAGWKGGEFFVEAFDIHGHGPSRSLVGNLQLVSNIEATPSFKLYDLWLDQKLLDGKLSVRFGQEGVNDELMTTTYGGLFINSSFGFPGMAAAVLPSGGPNYPLATPFVRAQYGATDNITLVGAVFNGDPAPATRRSATATAPPSGSTIRRWALAKSGISRTLMRRPISQRRTRSAPGIRRATFPTSVSTRRAACSPVQRARESRDSTAATGRSTASSIRSCGHGLAQKTRASGSFCR